MVTSDKILSPHLDLSKGTPKPAKIEAYNSHMFIPNTETSWSYDISMPSSPHFVKGSYGEVLGIRKTSNNKFVFHDFNEYGDASPTIDDFNRYVPDSFGKWKHAAEDRPPNSFSYAALPKETGVMISFGERKANFPHPGDTPLTKYVADLFVSAPNNRIGKYISRIESSVRQKLNNYLRTDDGKDLSSYLASLGLSPEDIGYIGVGFLPKGAIYGVDRASDGKVILTATKDAYDKITKDARFFGVEPEDLLNSVLAEEMAHIWRRDFDKDGNLISIEMSAKDIVAKHYARLAKNSEGDPKKEKLRRKYHKLAAVKEWDTLTTKQRYTKSHNSYKALYQKDRASLALLLELDAMEEGYRGEKIKEYVESKLKEIGDEVAPESMSRLERIAKSGGKEASSERESPKESAETAETAS